MDETISVPELRAYMAGGIAERAAATLDLFEKTREAPTITHTHDLSTSLRRLLVVDFAARTFWNKPLLGAARDPVNTFRKTLGNVRDAQEQLANFRGLALNNPFAKAFAASLEANETETKSGIVAAIEAFEVDLLKPFTRKTAMRQRLGGKPTRSLPAFLRSLLDKVEAKGREAIDGKDDTALHRMRVKYKRFRYAVELFSPRFTGLSKRGLKHLKSLQDAMGDAHDWLVLEEWAADFAGENDLRGERKVLNILRKKKVTAHREARALVLQEIPKIKKAKYLQETQAGSAGRH